MRDLSWNDFLQCLADKYVEGTNDLKLSEEFGGKEVLWKGVVNKLAFIDEYAPGVSIEMDDPEIPLGKSKKLIANSVFLNVDDDCRASWKDAKVGDEVTFSAVIRKSNGPFAGVQLSEFEPEPDVILMLGLDKGKRI